MSLLGLAALSLAVSPSGALAPGPLTVASIAEGAKSRWRAGVSVAAGHMVFELPYTLLLTLAAARMSMSALQTKAMGIAAAVVIAFFAVLTFRDARRGFKVSEEKRRLEGRPFMAGLLLTGLNPYFLLWWVGVGWPLLAGAAEHMPAGFPVMYTAHVWYDFAWLALMAYLGEKGAAVLGTRGYRALLAALGALLLLLAVDMLAKSLLGLALLPL